MERISLIWVTGNESFMLEGVVGMESSRQRMKGRREKLKG